MVWFIWIVSRFYSNHVGYHQTRHTNQKKLITRLNWGMETSQKYSTIHNALCWLCYSIVSIWYKNKWFFGCVKSCDLNDESFSKDSRSMTRLRTYNDETNAQKYFLTIYRLTQFNDETRTPFRSKTSWWKWKIDTNDHVQSSRTL